MNMEEALPLLVNVLPISNDDKFIRKILFDLISDPKLEQQVTNFSHQWEQENPS